MPDPGVSTAVPNQPQLPMRALARLRYPHAGRALAARALAPWLADPTIRRALVQAVHQSPTPALSRVAVELLGPFVATDPEVRAAFIALTRHGQVRERVGAAEALMPLSAAYEVQHALLPLLLARDPALRAVAVTALHSVPLRAAVRQELLRQLVVAHPLARAAIVAVLAGDLDQAETQSALIGLGATDPDPMVRRATAYFLAEIAAYPPIQATLIRLAADRDADVRFLALDALGPYAFVPAVQAAIWHALGDACPDVRAAAAAALSLVASAPPIRYRLLALLAPDLEPPVVRVAAALALRWQLGNRLVRKCLHRQMTSDPDGEVRRATAWAIESPGGGLGIGPCLGAKGTPAHGEVG